MGLIVQKFGGSSVADAEKLANAARIVANAYKNGNDVIAVVSAQGDSTDRLIEKANEVNANASKRELDALLASGEQVSAALLAMAVEKLGFPARSLLGWQAGFHTDSRYGAARIKNIDVERVKMELSKKNVVVIAGFQGINKYDDVTTLGRGGSDASAVAVAAATHADLCQIFTDVEGVYTADPRKVKNARKISEIAYDEMLELATLGAKILNNRSVETAKKYNVRLEVLSSLVRKPGTIIKETTSNMEKTLIRGVTADKDVARISIIGVPDVPGIAYKIFGKLASKNINVDIILQSVGRNGLKDIAFTVAKPNVNEAVEALRSLDIMNGLKIVDDVDLAKVSVVGAGMESHPGVAAKMFQALFESDINIQMIATSEIKISVLIDADDADKAVEVIHDAFIPPENRRYS